MRIVIQIVFCHRWARGYWGVPLEAFGQTPTSVELNFTTLYINFLSTLGGYICCRSLTAISSCFRVIMISKEYFVYETKLFLFNLIRTIFIRLDAILDFFTTFSLLYGTKKERISAVKTQKFAHKVKVICGVPQGLLEANPDNFIFTHKSYETSEFILRREDFTLFGLTKKTAIFCRTTSDIWNIREYPFAVLGQWKNAQELIFMEIDEFHRMAAEIMAEPKYQLGFIYIMARSGSTLLCQMLNRLPRYMYGKY